MSSMKYLIVGIGILTLVTIVTHFYDFFKREDDSLIQFVRVMEGNPRITYRFKGVTLNEADALKKSLSERAVDSHNVHPYYEVISGEFNFNIEGVSMKEAEGIVRKVVNGSGLDVNNF